MRGTATTSDCITNAGQTDSRFTSLFRECVERGIWTHNGDEHFCREMCAVIDAGCDEIFETGTYKGWTSYFLARAFPNLYVLTCETDEALFGEAANLLAEVNGAIAIRCSSPELLMAQPRRALPFFFLDAHSQHNCPLVDELKVINRFGRGVVCIHDFVVPGADCYGFDRYHGKALDESFVASELAGKRFFYPAQRSFDPPDDGLHPKYTHNVLSGPESRRRGRCYVGIDAASELMLGRISGLEIIK